MSLATTSTASSPAVVVDLHLTLKNEHHMTRNLMSRRIKDRPQPGSHVRSRLWLLAISMTVSLMATSPLSAQDTKREYVPEKIDAPPPTSSSRSEMGGPAGPMNTADLRRRAAEANLARRDRSVEQKLIRIVRSARREDPKRPLYLDRLAQFYWQLAGDSQNRAYQEEERCFGGSAKTDADIDRCDAVRVKIEGEAEEFRSKAIGLYKVIVQEHPDFEDIDKILFALGFNYQQKQQNEDAKQIYTELIQNYQSSEVLPDALFNMADIYFASGDVDNAAALYNHVRENFPQSSVYIYAIYKLGWCAYNQTKFKDALGHFIEVINLQNKRSERDKRANRLSLKKEAQRDLIRVYVNIAGATAKGGISLIKKYAPQRFDELAESLADLYAGTGQFDSSNRILRTLIKKSNKSYRVVGYQRRVTENIANMNNSEEAILALKRLVSLWQSAKDAPDADPKRVNEDHKGIELQLNAMARRYHNQALETKSARDFNTALELYSTYVKNFPNESTSYEMNFFYGELLYKLQKWAPAAEVYEQVLKMKPDGQFTKDAAHGALLAYKTLLKADLDKASIDSIGKESKESQEDSAQSKSKKRKRRGKRKGKETKQPKAKFPPKEIPKDYGNYLKASKLYRQYVSESEYLIDIQYEEARVYYVFNQFDQAIPLFKDIAERAPKHKVAVYAANLLLECFNRQGNFDELSKQVNIFVPLYPPSIDAEFATRLKTLKSELDFQKCSLIENRGESIRAARCFLTYARRFPKSKIVDKAYYNAAVNYDREKQMEKAIEARKGLIENVEGSDLAPKAFYQIARNLQALAIYSSASNVYEQFAASYPKREEATEALRLAAQFRLGLGELDKATEDLKQYIKRLGKKERKQAMEAYFELGRVLQERKQWARVVKHFQQFTKQFKNVDAGYVIKAYTALGNAIMSQPKRYRNRKQALSAYQSAVNTYDSIPKSQVKDLPLESRSAAAEALFKLVNNDFKQVRGMPFTKFPPLRDAQKHVKKIQTNIVALLKEMERIKKRYEMVIGMNVEEWSLAALTQIGEMFNFGFTTLEQTTPPKIFDIDTADFFRQSMEEKAEPFRQKAIQAYKVCLEKAREVQWFNEWTDLSEQQIAKINPEAYRYSIEERAQASYLHNNTLRLKLVTELPAEEEDDI